MLLLFPPTFKTRDFCVAWSLNVNSFCLSVQSRQDEISQKMGIYCMYLMVRVIVNVRSETGVQ